MQQHGKVEHKRSTIRNQIQINILIASRQAHPSSALGFVNNEQLRNRSSM